MEKKSDILYPEDVAETLKHRDILKKKSFLRKLYIDWYNYLINKSKEVENKEGKILEIGSGGGFFKEIFSEVITSDILKLDNVDEVFNAEQLPFSDNSLKSIVMINVFHHIPRPYLLLEEAQRSLVEGGKILMIEPANSSFARFIYTRFHSEPFDVNGEREIKADSPLFNSNQALPYIYFERDLPRFQSTYKQLTLKSIHYHTPFSYLLSGGFSKPSLLPGFMYSTVKFAEGLLRPFNRKIGLFCTIEIEKIKNI
ncbi:MAG: class I SAM-dependent methyltransferase [Prevotellaceae bacterium]|jgi:SAM-dependent methyltransferase|nr:class I SAM-dependent methyltransferase [Prevotellaceae bacterium]